MTADLRHLALILNAGRKAADNLRDAGLSSALEHMTEVAVEIARAEAGERTIWDVEADFNELADKYR